MHTATTKDQQEEKLRQGEEKAETAGAEEVDDVGYEAVALLDENNARNASEDARSNETATVAAASTEAATDAVSEDEEGRRQQESENRIFDSDGDGDGSGGTLSFEFSVGAHAQTAAAAALNFLVNPADGSERQHIVLVNLGNGLAVDAALANGKPGDDAATQRKGHVTLTVTCRTATKKEREQHEAQRALLKAVGQPNKGEGGNIGGTAKHSVLHAAIVRARAARVEQALLERATQQLATLTVSFPNEAKVATALRWKRVTASSGAADALEGIGRCSLAGCEVGADIEGAILDIEGGAVARALALMPEGVAAAAERTGLPLDRWLFERLAEVCHYFLLLMHCFQPALSHCALCTTVLYGCHTIPPTYLSFRRQHARAEAPWAACGLPESMLCFPTLRVIRRRTLSSNFWSGWTAWTAPQVSMRWWRTLSCATRRA